MPHFKGYLARSPMRTLARGGGRSYAARDVARLFLRELLGEVQRETGERIRELVVTVPVDSFEAYRGELSSVLRRLGVSRVRFVDEPVAAALGYGIGLSHQRLSLVVDFGGGTLDLALVRFEPAASARGHCHLIAKTGRAVGGNLVDRWLLEHLCQVTGVPAERLSTERDAAPDAWEQLMLAAARRAKEAVFFDPSATLTLLPPDERWEFDARLRGAASSSPSSRASTSYSAPPTSRAAP
ncbi:MAG: Hsp70 family protein [Myxococcales bacterium]